MMLRTGMKKGLIIGAVAAGVVLVLVIAFLIVVRQPVMYLIARSLTSQGMKLDDLHRDDDAMRAYDAAIKADDQYAPAFARRAYLEVRLGKYQDALRDGDRAVTLNKDLGLDWSARGYAHEWLGQDQAASDDYDEAIRLDPNIAVYHSHLSFVARRLNDLPKAKAEIARAIELEPRAPLAYDDRALIDLDLGDVAAAEADESHAVELSPEWAAAHAHRAWVHIWEGKFDDAISDANDAFNLKPNYGYALYLRSVAERRKGDPQSAEQTITRLLSLAPTYREAHFERALAYYDAGDLNAARADLKAGENDVGAAGRTRIWLWIVDTESGQGTDADTALAAWLTDKPPATNDQKVAALVLGRTTPDALAQEVSSHPNVLKKQALLCQIWYYAGKAALLKNDRAQARADFEKAIESKACEKAEFGEALREFAKL